MKKLLIAATTLIIAGSNTFAEEAAADPEPTAKKLEIINLGADVRVDYQHLSWDGTTQDNNSGFEGKYFMFKVDGEIIPGLTYSWRQRLNKMHSDGNFFDATDWIYLDWAHNKFNFSAGKQIVAIGGWEYDRNPMDLYGTSVFWQNIACYQLGASVAYHTSAHDKIMAQVTQSPSHTTANRNMYAYNAIWYGNHGWYNSIWSANLVEYEKNHYISYLALGNKFDYDKVSLELDYMNRADKHQAFWGKDFSVMAELSWSPKQTWRIHGKYTYDANHTNGNGDVTVLSGTELNMIGGGLEFFPLLKKKTSLRLHANCYYAWGNNANSGDFMQDKSLFVTVGVKWHIDIFSIKH
jgi:hypothetical protein